MADGQTELQRDRDSCPSCGVPWDEHLGIAGTCKMFCHLRSTLPLSGDNERLTLGVTVYVECGDGWESGPVEELSFNTVLVDIDGDSYRVDASDVFVNKPTGRD